MLVALTLLLPGAAMAVAPIPAVRLTASGPASIQFDVSVPAPRFAPVPGGGAAPAPLELRLEGFSSDAPAGSPALPARIVVVAVPPLGEVRVTASGEAAEAHDGLLLAPQPYAVPGDRSNTPVYWSSDTAYAGAGARPGVRARLLGVAWLRNQRIARIVVYPADYDAAARRLTLYRRVQVSVRVEVVGDLGPPAESPDPFETVYRGALLNYEQGRGWRRPHVRRLVGRAGATFAELALADPVLRDTSVFAGRTWIKLAVRRTGFYKVTYGQLRNYAMFTPETGATPVDSLRLFTWAGFPVLPQDSYCDDCDYREVAMGVGTEDQTFNDNADYLYFFAMGPSDWASLYDPAYPETVFIDHPYETANYYYLTRATSDLPVGGTPARIVPRANTITDPGLPTPATFPARAHYEEDHEYFPAASPRDGVNDSDLFWEKWFWISLTQGGAFTVPVAPPGADTTQGVRMRSVIWGLNYNRARPGYVKTIKDHFLDVSFNGVSMPTRVFDWVAAQVYDTTFSTLLATENKFRMSVQARTDPGNPERTDQCGLAWFDLYYMRRFEPVDDALAFDSPSGGNGDVIYRIGPFVDPRQPRLFDVTDPIRPEQIVPVAGQFQSGPGGWYLTFQASEPSRRRYRVVRDSLPALLSQDIGEAPRSAPENYRDTTQRADYILIYYDGFKTAADSLAAWRRTHLPVQGFAAPFNVKAVPVSSVYDQFSGGRADPMAIRNFLRTAYYNWNGRAADPARRPLFVTFLGDASYDFKNIKGRAQPGQPGALVPSFEDGYDTSQLRQFATDDWLLCVDRTDPEQIVPSFLGGRIPVEDAATALGVVRSKVLGYERSSPLGEWHNKVMLIADDNMQGNAPDDLQWAHLDQTVTLDVQFTPPHIDRQYVYLHTYPTGPGATKPGANADIRRNLNEGSAITNFVGHGSPFQLADERVMLDSDVGSFRNAPRFTVFISASCDVGAFDNPVVRSLGEAMMTSTIGGAVGVISATDLAISGRNAYLNQLIYSELFERDTLDCRYHVPLAEALLKTKYGDFNEQKYQLMGDAATRLWLPRQWVVMSLADSAGDPVTEMRRGQTLTFRGQVLDCPGGVSVPFDGVAGLLIEDSQEVDSVLYYGDYLKYPFKAGAIYRGDVRVANGEFEGRFIVPLEAREGARGRVRAYIQGRAVGEGFDSDGVGSSAVAVADGEAAPGDDAGPRITLSFVGGSTTVRPDAVLTVDLYDPSGILTTGHSPQNGIVVTLDGNTTTRTDITSSFRYAANSYQGGNATFQLPNLALGAHSVSVSAADNLAAGLTAGAHRSRATLDFMVEEVPGLRISGAYLFPNPAESGGPRSGGLFVVNAPGDSVNTLLRLYTASGRLIRTLTVMGARGQVQLPWDGLDEEGQALANGVYFFRVHVNPRDPDGASNPRQKADADGRIVILNRK